MNLRENIKMFDNEIGTMGMEWRWLEKKHIQTGHYSKHLVTIAITVVDF